MSLKGSPPSVVRNSAAELPRADRVTRPDLVELAPPEIFLYAIPLHYAYLIILPNMIQSM